MFVIPLLPIHILGIFSELTYSGVVFTIIEVFLKIYLCILQCILYICYSCIQSLDTFQKKNHLRLLKNQIPAYLTAVGTQSSAATIPVNIQSGLKKWNK